MQRGRLRCRSKTNARNVDGSNIFDGSFGYAQPVLVNASTIASSQYVDALKLTASTISGASDSLAQQPDYRAAAEAITAHGAVTQAYFIAPEDISSATDGAMMSPLSMVSPDQPQPGTTTDHALLPAYTLTAIADSATATEEQALVALVYLDSSDAAAAAALFPAHLTSYQSLVAFHRFGDLLDAQGVTSIESSVFTPSVDRSVMLLTLSAPLISADAAELIDRALGE